VSRIRLNSKFPAWFNGWLTTSLANRLTFGVLLGTIAMLTVTGFCSYVTVSVLMTRNIERDLQWDLTKVAEPLETRLAQIEKHLQSTSASPFVVGSLNDGEDPRTYLQTFLKDQLREVPDLMALGLLDLRSETLVSLENPDRRGHLPPPLVLRQLFPVARPAACLLKDDRRPALLLMQPLEDPSTGEKTGALVGQVDLAGLFRARTKNFRPGYVHRLLLGQTAILQGPQAEKPEGLFSLTRSLHLDAPLKDLDLRIEVGLDRAEIFSPLRQLVSIFLAIGTILLFLAYGLSRLLGQRLAQPIIELSRTAAEVVAGNRQSLVVNSAGQDETAVLARSLAELVDKLHSANRGLEARVLKQTESLQASQALLANIVENIPLAVGVCELGSENNWILWNRAAHRLFGTRTLKGLGQEGASILPVPLPLETTLPGPPEGIWSYSSEIRDPETGRELVVETRALGLFDDQGQITHLVAISEDVTERRRNETLVLNIARGVSAQTGEGFFRGLSEHLAEALDADIVLVGELSADRRSVRTIAVRTDGGVGDNFSYLLPGSPCEPVLSGGSCSYRKGVSRLFPEDALLAEMSIEAFVGAPLLDPDGQVLGVLVVLFRRVLEQPEMAENMLRIFAVRAAAELVRLGNEFDLQRNREWFQSIFQNAFSGICTVGMDGCLTAANAVMLEMLGTDEKALNRLSLPEIFHPEDWFAMHREFADLRKGALDALRREVRLRARDGREHWVEMAFTSACGEENWPQFAIGIFQDIGERRRVERAVKMDRLRFEALYRLSQMLNEPEATLVSHALEDAVRITGSGAGCLYFVDEEENGLTLRAWTGQGRQQCTPEQANAESEALENGLVEEALHRRAPVFVNDFSGEPLPEGGEAATGRPLDRHLAVPLLMNGRAVLVAGMSRKGDLYDESDVRHLTLIMDGMWRCLQHRRAEEALRASELRYRELSQQFQALLAGIPDRITLLSPGLRVIWTNHGVPQAEGASEEARVFCYQLWHQHADICVDCPPSRAFANARAEQGQIETVDGRTWDVRAIPILDDGRVVNVIELAQDITERMRVQEQSIRTAHLASLGELAAGVAHEINNPVNGIINYAQILADRLQQEKGLADLGGRIIREGERISAIVHRLLEFARPQQAARRAVDAAEELRESLALSAAQLRRNHIECRLEVGRELPLIKEHPGPLRQVFLNIINNARHALDEKYPGGDSGKVLDIRISRVPRPRERVRLVFTDYGSGIARENLERVMNPFFTTKPFGKGTGLGLSISHGIIIDHGGTLKIESLAGHYTRVRIELPTLANHG
jgi:PAS domain S-box-containing protein